jgi:hypothetical protein
MNASAGWRICWSVLHERPSGNHSISTSNRRAADLAVQYGVGILPKWRAGSLDGRPGGGAINAKAGTLEFYGIPSATGIKV